MSQPASSHPASAKVSQPEIFVVDDNKMLVEFAVAVLEESGYKASGFTDPRDVLQAMKAASVMPVLLITDYDMGPMTGLELIISARKLKPDLKTLLLSGTVDGSIIVKHPAKVNRFLGKPYQPGQLKVIVAELLR